MKKIKNQKGITLVSLVVTIIILIILAGISINAVIGENGIITLAKRAKENIELAQIEEQTELNELYTQLEHQEELTEGTPSYNAVLKLNEFKKKIADYIDEAANGEIDSANEYVKPNYQTASDETFGNAIKQIVAKVTALDETKAATAEDIAQGKEAWVNGSKLIGTNTSDSDWSALQLYVHSYGGRVCSIINCEEYNTLTIEKIEAYTPATVCFLYIKGDNSVVIYQGINGASNVSYDVSEYSTISFNCDSASKDCYYLIKNVSLTK